MTIARSPAITLETFLQLPETKPASQFIAGQIIQKPMPKARHSRLQGKLSTTINAIAEPARIAYAFPELRCTFDRRSIVPDIAVLRWQQIQLDANGEPLDDIQSAPAWTIEILSPDQSANRVTGNILHCLKSGCELGWLLDPSDRSILVFLPQQQPELCTNDDTLPILSGINLNLTVAEVFDWLKMSD